MKKMMFFYSVIMLFVTLTDRANATYFPIDYTWDQPEGLGSDITLTYSYSNLLDGNMLDFNTGKPISTVSLRAAFEAALWDYAKILPIHFRVQMITHFFSTASIIYSLHEGICLQ